MVQSNIRYYSVRRRVIRWAALPFQGNLGKYIGVALENGEIHVAIQTCAAPRWVKASEALSPFEAEAWARTGFRRPLGKA